MTSDNRRDRDPETEPEVALVPRGPGRWFALLMVAAAFLSTVALAAMSEGTHHADDITHHLFARFAWHDARYLLDNWGRPGFTILYVPLAWVGLFGSRLTSAILSAIVAWFAYLTAGRLGIRRPYLVPLLLFVQPMFIRLSYTSLTETPLALYLIVALWLWVVDRRMLSAAVISLAMVTRHEACVWLVVWGVALAWRRRWWALPVLAWAPAAHNLLALIFLGEAPFAQYLAPGGDVYFGAGTLLHYVVRLPLVCGFGLLPLALGGLFLLPRRRGRLLVLMSVATYFGVQTLIYAMGLYSSGGYARFLVPLCPVLAVTACAALDRILDGAGRPVVIGLVVVAVGLLLALGGRVEQRVTPDEMVSLHQLFTWSIRVGLLLAVVGGVVVVVGLSSGTAAWWVLQGVAAILLVVTVGQTAGMNRPYRLRPVEQGLKKAAEFVRDRYPGRRAISFNPWYPYFAGEIHRWGNYPRRRQIEDAPVGTIVIWEWDLAPTDYFKVTEDWLDGQWWLQEVWWWQAPEWSLYPPCVRVFEKVAEHRPSQSRSA